MKITHTYIAIASAVLWAIIGCWLFSQGTVLFWKKMLNGHELSASFALLISWFFVHFRAQEAIAKYTHASFTRMETAETTKERALRFVKEHAKFLPLFGLNSMLKFVAFAALFRATLLTTAGFLLLYGAYSYFGMRTYAAVRQ